MTTAGEVTVEEDPVPPRVQFTARHRSSFSFCQTKTWPHDKRAATVVEVVVVVAVADERVRATSGTTIGSSAAKVPL